MDLPFLPPRLLARQLFTKNRERFDKLFLGGHGDGSALEQFWKSAAKAKDPRLATHPMIAKPNWQRRAIPISLHGDAVPAIGVGKAHSRSYDCYIWQSLLAMGI